MRKFYFFTRDYWRLVFFYVKIIETGYPEEANEKRTGPLLRWERDAGKRYKSTRELLTATRCAGTDETPNDQGALSPRPDPATPTYQHHHHLHHHQASIQESPAHDITRGGTRSIRGPPDVERSCYCCRHCSPFGCTHEIREFYSKQSRHVAAVRRKCRGERQRARTTGGLPLNRNVKESKACIYISINYYLRASTLWHFDSMAGHPIDRCLAVDIVGF